MAVNTTTGDVSTLLGPNDHGPAVILTAAIMLGVAVLSLGVRLWQRWPWTSLLRSEDAFLILATICEVATVTTAALAVRAGLGQHESAIPQVNVERARQYISATYALTFLTEGLGYVSFVLLLRNTCIERQFRTLALVISVLIAVWSAAGILRFALGADVSLAEPSKPSWIGFAVVSLLIQVVEVVLVFRLILPLRLQLARKVECIAWFVCIIPVSFATTIVRLVYVPERSFGHDFVWRDARNIIILLVQSNLILVSAGTSGLRGVIDQLSTGFLVADTSTVGSRKGSVTSWRLRKLSKSNHMSSTPENTTSDSSFNPSRVQFEAKVVGNPHSIRSNASQAIMVRRSIEVDATSLPSEHGHVEGSHAQ